MTSAGSSGKLPAFVMLAGTLISLSGLTCGHRLAP